MMMLYIKHLIKYSVFVLAATIFSIFAAWSWIENIGFIFGFPASKTIALFSLAYGLCVGSLGIMAFYYQAKHAPTKPFLMGFLILVMCTTILYFSMGGSVADFAFMTLIYFLGTAAARLRGKTNHQQPENQLTYFPFSTFKLILFYFLTLGLIKYVWWYKQWSYIKIRDKKNYSPLARSVFAVFFYESFLEDITKTSRKHGLRGIKHPATLTTLYILFLLGTVFIFSINAAYNTFGLDIQRSVFSLTNLFSIFIFVCSLFLYLIPQLAINQLNKLPEPQKLSYPSIPATLFVYCLLSTAIWLPLFAKCASLYRSETRNAFILYDYGHFQAAYNKAATQADENEKDADAKLLLGQMYLYGKGVVQDPEQAASWLEDAATLGNVEAQYLVGALYRAGINNQAPDYKRSALWFQKAMEGGNPYATNDLATLYAAGLGVEKNPAKALALYHQAAKKGDGYAMYNIGLHYEKEITPPDYVVAADWFEKSLKATPNICAYNDLGMLYAAGNGVKQNQDESEKLLQNAGRKLISEYDLNIERKLLAKDKAIDEAISAFVAYQSAQAMKKNNDKEIEKQYSPQALIAAKAMSKKIVNSCWE